jgi:hypothetical protein
VEVKHEELNSYIDGVKSLLALKHEKRNVINLLQWTVCHSLVRSYQLSLAFYMLSPKMTWDMIESCGTTNFAEANPIPDRLVAPKLLDEQKYPGDFFDLQINFSGSSSIQPNKDSGLLAVCTRVEPFPEGLFMINSDRNIEMQNDLWALAFLRISAEYIYHDYHMQHEEVQHEVENLLTHANDPASIKESEKLRIASSELTDRQKRILDLIAKGATNEEIAQALEVSLGTVRVETSRLFDRLGVRNRQHAATFAYLLE